MPNSFSKIHIHLVFAVEHREAMIHPRWEEKLFKYISGGVSNYGQKMLAINGVSDHIHFLIGMRPECRLSDLTRELKKSSTEFIKRSGFCDRNFNWQSGYGAFSHGASQLDTVIKYIHNQKIRHKEQRFKDEYIQLLKKHQIEFDEKHLFKWLDE